jgi:tripartite-type tricarboxylate transporter receptor subunit TctC
MPGRFLVALALAVSTASLCSPAASADGDPYPSRAVRIIVPFAAGGPPDVIARIVAQKLSERLGQQFYVEDRPGAGGNTGNADAARAAPDGYTLLMMSTGFIVNVSLYSKLPYDPVRDFSPVSLLCSSPNVITVHPSVPAHSVRELIDVIRAAPGKYSYAQPSTGSTPHLSGELFKQRFGLDLVMVPFNGASLAVNSTLAGQTPVAFTAVPPAAGAIKGGALRGLAVTSAHRIAALPDVPTMAEAGVPDQEAETLNGVLVPAGTPPEIVARLHREIAAVIALPDVQERLVTLGFTPLTTTPDEFAARIRTEMEKWDRVIREAKISIQN